MNARKLHLLNVARKALFQRARLERSVGGAQANLVPAALKQRARQNVSAALGRGTAAAEASLRKYSLPLGLAAAAGLLFAFRKPLSQAVDAAMDLLESQNADAAAAQGSPAPSPNESQPEHDDDPV